MTADPRSGPLSPFREPMIVIRLSPTAGVAFASAGLNEQGYAWFRGVERRMNFLWAP
jgi:hypothetical protein